MEITIPEFVLYEIQRANACRLFYRPRQVTISIDSRCNLRCRYCGYHGEYGMKMRPFFLNFEQVKSQIDIIKDHVEHIHICAVGEPFLNKDIFLMFDYLNKIGHRPTILTNGSRVVSNKLDRIMDSNLAHYNTDVDTLDRDKYISLCGKDELTNVLDNIEKLANLKEQRKSDMKIMVNTIITKQNLEELHRIYFRLTEIGVDTWNLNFLSIDDEDKGFLSKENALTGQEDKVYPVIIGLREHEKRNVTNIAVTPYFDPNIDNDKLQCNWLWDHLMLNIPIYDMPQEEWYGNVVTGCALSNHREYYLGNIFKTDLLSIWNSNTLKDLRRKMLNNQIAHCKNTCLNNRFD